MCYRFGTMPWATSRMTAAFTTWVQDPGPVELVFEDLTFRVLSTFHRL